MKKMLYHVTGDHDHTGVFTPRIPENRMEGEDTTTPRICFADSLSGALDALGGANERVNLTVFWLEVDTDDPYVLTPEELYSLVPDAGMTGEHWLTRPVTVQDRAFIRLTYLDWSEYCLLKPGTSQRFYDDEDERPNRHYHTPKYYYLLDSRIMPCDTPVSKEEERKVPLFPAKTDSQRNEEVDWESLEASKMQTI